MDIKAVLDMQSNNDIVEIFWRGYQGLGKRDRQQVVRRILMDLDVSEDWIDHILIERAKNEHGEDVSLDEFHHTEEHIVNV